MALPSECGPSGRDWGRPRGRPWGRLAVAVGLAVGLSLSAAGVAGQAPGAQVIASGPAGHLRASDAAVDAALGALDQGDRAWALAELARLAALGNAYAMAVLGDVAYFGWRSGPDGQPDYAGAYRWYRAAAELAHAGGHYGLARLYLRGHGVDKDVARALAHLARVDEAGPLDFRAETFGGACLPPPEPRLRAERALRAYFHYAPLERPGSWAQVDRLRAAFPCD